MSLFTGTLLFSQSCFRRPKQIEKIRKLRRDCKVEPSPRGQDIAAGGFLRGREVVTTTKSQIGQHPKSEFCGVSRASSAGRWLEQEACLYRPINSPGKQVLRAGLGQKRQRRNKRQVRLSIPAIAQRKVAV